MNKLIKEMFLKKHILLMLVFVFIAVNIFAASPDKVQTYQDEKGWKLKVNGEDYFVKGIVWGYSPIGENYSYNLWSYPDEHIQKVLDYECNLMKTAGINTIRSFGLIPPNWVEYIYEQYGIMTIVNHLMGRYGYTVDGAWIVQTNYSDDMTRKTLTNDMVELVKQYKDTPGVLMFALGNENNYGLEWSSFEIENLPVGERHKEKAKYLYSMYNEIIREAKKIDKNHPFAIVNGDIQYLDLIVEYCKDLDILGVNAYRGISFTDMWERVKNEANLPVMLTEFGSDAFNALENREDQAGQAYIVKGNWTEIYNKSYDKGEEGIALGGCLFEWRDEWWKYLQVENLDVHDNNASWSNGGYSFDFVKGVNNMNEEWFGICGLGGPNDDGVFVAEPRMTYDVMSRIWAIDPYEINKKKMNEKIDAIDMTVMELVGNMRLLKNGKGKSKAIELVGGNLQGDMVFNGKSEEVENKGKNGLEFSNGEMLFLDFEFEPNGKIKGDFTINVLGNVVDKQMEEYYGKRGEIYTTVITEEGEAGVQVNTIKEITDAERVEIYDFQGTYSNAYFNFTTFYHVPRFHWIYDGDVYGLMYEATDMEGMDIWNAKAPYGVEFVGKEFMPGLTVVAGPEVYWGANPKAMIKYDFGTNKYKYTFVHSEDFARADASSTATEATTRATRQTALSLTTQILPKAKLELGYLFAGSEKIDEDFYYTEDNKLYKDKIDFMDTQGFKAKVTLDVLKGAKLDFSLNYAGLVADGGSPLREFDTTMPYSSLGNKIVYEAGMLLPIGNFWLLPRGMYRTNIVEADTTMNVDIEGTTLIPGNSLRNRDSDPFAVLDNRETISGEFFVTYDPTPASYFYDWDAERKEDAKIAFSIGANYTKYKAESDAYLFYYDAGETNAPFGSGLAAEELWLVKGRFILNPRNDFRIISNIETGKQQSSGNPDGTSPEYFSFDAKFVFDKQHYVSMYAKKDAWGPLDWYRQFNITFPYQFMLDYSCLIDNFLDERFSSRIGVRTLLRTLDANSPTNEGDGVDNDYEFQTGLYYRIEF